MVIQNPATAIWNVSKEKKLTNIQKSEIKSIVETAAYQPSIKNILWLNLVSTSTSEPSRGEKTLVHEMWQLAREEKDKDM
jgi:hypothetical protein